MRRGKPAEQDTDPAEPEVRELLACYDIGEVSEVRRGGGTGSATYRITSSRGAYFLRRRGPRTSSEDRVAFDHRVRAFLTQRGVHAVPPLASAGGPTWRRTGSEVYELCPFVDGHQHRWGDRAELVSLARELARFHLATALLRTRIPVPPMLGQFSLAAPSTPPSSRIDDPGSMHHALASCLASLTPAERKVVERMLRGVEEVSAHLGTDAYRSVDRYVIHGDLHRGNVLFDDAGGVCGILDLDWACCAPRLRDVAEALHFFASRPTAAGSDIWALTSPPVEDPELAELLLAEYSALAPLSPQEEELLPWAWLGRWIGMHIEGMYKVPPELRGRFLTAGFDEALPAITRRRSPGRRTRPRRTAPGCSPET